MLRTVVAILKSTLRDADILGRYGGDEFLAILPGTDRREAANVAKRIASTTRVQRFAVQRKGGLQPVNLGADLCIPIHLSIGSAVFPTDSSHHIELIGLADAAMYAAKRAGDGAATAESTTSGFLASQDSVFTVLNGLLNTIDGKDHYTRQHSEQVSQLALGLAELIDLPYAIRKQLRMAGLLHDIGKIGIPDRALRKPGRLDAHERSMLEQHTVLGELIVRSVPQLADIVEVVRDHHERIDGTGYPRGLRGEEIPYLARLIAVVDSYSAMTLDRPYRRALSQEEAAYELQKVAGTQLDAELVRQFRRSIEAFGPEDPVAQKYLTGLRML
jgi:diguanylate cyclase (GGDEF)-like protein/putative nucleotidyltransferase with HDIG domain